MVQARVGGDAVKRVASAGFGIGAAVDDERQPGLDDGAGTHRARLQGDIEEAVFQPPGMQRRGGLGNGDHFRVGGWIVQLLALVVCPTDDALPQRHDDSADRHLILGRG